jgi:hypothetical protein
MTVKLTSEDGKACYAKRKESVEPVFGQIKHGRGASRFLRRGFERARRSGSCRAAPTTYSNCGATRSCDHRPGRQRPELQPRADAAVAANADRPAGRGPSAPRVQRIAGDPLQRLRNTLVNSVFHNDGLGWFCTPTTIV